jgi:hypothetical protein
VPVSRHWVWHAAWYAGNGQERTGDGTRLFYGVSDPFTGRNRSLIGFNYPDISGHLSGSTINSCFLRMQDLNTAVDTGATLHLGIHNFSTKPATWTGGGIPASMILKHRVADVVEIEIPLPLVFAQKLRDVSAARASRWRRPLVTPDLWTPSPSWYQPESALARLGPWPPC